MESTRPDKSYNGLIRKIGDKNEEDCILFFYPRCVKLYDVRLEPDWQKRDIDIILLMASGRIVHVELKADRMVSEIRRSKEQTGNVFFEICRLNHGSKNFKYYEGWGSRSKADWLLARNPDFKEAFLFDFKKLRNAVDEYVLEEGKNVETRMMKIVTSDKKTTAHGYAVPMKRLKNIYTKHII